MYDLGHAWVLKWSCFRNILGIQVYRLPKRIIRILQLFIKINICDTDWLEVYNGNMVQPQQIDINCFLFWIDFLLYGNSCLSEIHSKVLHVCFFAPSLTTFQVSAPRLFHFLKILEKCLIQFYCFLVVFWWVRWLTLFTWQSSTKVSSPFKTSSMEWEKDQRIVYPYITITVNIKYFFQANLCTTSLSRFQKDIFLDGVPTGALMSRNHPIMFYHIWKYVIKNFFGKKSKKRF